MLLVLNSGWTLALIVLVFGGAFGRLAARAFRRGKKFQALATCLWALGWSIAASVGFVGIALGHSVHVEDYGRALRLLRVMYVCGAASVCLILVGTALVIYSDLKARAGRRKGRASETDSVIEPDQPWPPSPKRPAV